MRNKFDKVAKGIGEEALGTSGTVSINAEVSPETQHAAEGHAAGSAHTRAHDLLTVLQARRIPVSAAARKRILEQKNLKQLERWLKRASVATSLEEVLGSRA